jgi:hypothetical protein
VRECGSARVRECESARVRECERNCGCVLNIGVWSDWRVRRAPTGLAELAHLPQNCWGRLNSIAPGRPSVFEQLKPRSASSASRDGAFRFPSGGFSRSGPAPAGDASPAARLKACRRTSSWPLASKPADGRLPGRSPQSLPTTLPRPLASACRRRTSSPAAQAGSLPATAPPPLAPNPAADAAVPCILYPISCPPPFPPSTARCGPPRPGLCSPRPPDGCPQPQ